MKIQRFKPNQAVLDLANGTQVLFSYSTPVAAFVPSRGYLRTNRKYSVTTSKHINKWINGFDAKIVDQMEIDELAI